METIRLYYTDAYATTFEAEVVEVSDEGRRVYLDRTAFYPTSGGQPRDTGVLGGQRVVDVVDEGERIAHVLATPASLSTGEQVTGAVDRDRRFDHMQQHTGQHLLSAVFEELLGLPTISVHFGDDISTLDLRAPSIDPDRLLAVERRANEVVWGDRPVTVAFEAASEATGLRKVSERGGDLRVVSIDGLDRSACGGTHVRSTGEIGGVLLRRVERIRGNTRVEFLCGGRASRRARADYDALAAAAQLFSAPPDEVPSLVAGLRQQLREAQQALKAQREELATFRARDLFQRTPPDASGIRRIVLRNASFGADELRALAQAVAPLTGTILLGASDQPPSLLLATSEDSGIDAGARLRSAVTAVGGRGGGSARVAQGSVPDAAALDRVIEDILAGDV